MQVLLELVELAAHTIYLQVLLLERNQQTGLLFRFRGSILGFTLGPQ